MKKSIPIVLFAFMLLGTAQAQAQQGFTSPDDAVHALAEAARAHDRAGVEAILGPRSVDLVESGDAVQDAHARERFLAAYDAEHRIDSEDGRAVLVIGDQGWPFPIPLVHQDGIWTFDAAAGRKEILSRRIGRDELNAIAICNAYVVAQEDYARMITQERGTHAYASRIISHPGTKDGLLWDEGEYGKGPLSELAAGARAEGYGGHHGEAPFHGYYFKILTRQGPGAEDGPMDYTVNGEMTKGFALIAWPATYRNSGVMTFITNQSGVVYEKNLGPGTAGIAAGMSAFDLDGSWEPVR
ncbi:MAG: DUF2950 domain-containing protein [Alphaproteobacteria bacterium]